MLEKETQKTRSHRFLALGSWFMALVAVLLALQTIQAESPEQFPPDLSGSTKDVIGNDVVTPGSSVGYTVVISNSGTTPDLAVVMTDTLPSELAYETGSISVSGGGIYTVTGNVIAWSGAVNNNSEVTIQFSATLTNTAAAGTIITNTAEISGTTAAIERSVAITVVDDLFVYLPVIAKPVPPPDPPVAPVLNSIGRPTSGNSWDLSWSISNSTGVTGYVVEESNSSDFSSLTATYNTTSTNLTVTKPFSTDHVYYFRVRAMIGIIAGNWSNVRSVITGYRDNFSTDTTWAIRREDTDDSENFLLRENGLLIHRELGRWDYMITSPLEVAVAPPYRYDARIRFTGADNLHAYGLVFGGDWNGNNCPNPNYSSCFTKYYRLLVLWYGSPNTLRFNFKRIDSHDPVNNAGRGPTLIPFTDVNVNTPPDTWQNWSIEVNADGLIKIFVNGNLIGQVVDTELINRPYFGGFSATNEYAGLQVDFDWVQVTPLP
jgi:uncharacterized repeat protein (TIGR01451 family)